MTYVGQQPATTFDSGIQDRFTGLTTNTVTLNHEISAEEDILVVWNNIVQDKNTYSVGGTGNKTVTLGGTLVSADVVTVYYLNKVMQSVNPTAGSVGLEQLSATGTASSSNFLRGDNSWASAGTTINNNADNRVITGSGTANTLEGEANLTFDGTDLDVGASAKISSNGAIANFSNHNGSASETALATSDGNEKVRCFNDGKITFETNGSERMRIDSSGHLIVNGTAGITGTSLMVYNDTTESTAQFVNKATTGNHRGIDFNDGDDTLLGSINFNCGGNTVSYETSSDYRLKENVTDLTGAITRVKNLKPKRFNFKTKPDETIDGFLAHEVQSVIPEAASGTKDETETRKNVVVNAKGNVKACDITEAEWIEGKSNGVFANNTEWFASKEFIRPQGVDQSKLVPLLTSALQEAITKIETLEAKVTALENK